MTAEKNKSHLLFVRIPFIYKYIEHATLITKATNDVVELKHIVKIIVI